MKQSIVVSMWKFDAAVWRFRVEDVHRIGVTDGDAELCCFGVEIDGAGERRVEAAEIDGQLVVDRGGSNPGPLECGRGGGERISTG